MEHRPFEQLIDAYLADQLSPQERAAFETTLRSDASKKKIFQTHYLAEMAARLRQPDSTSETAKRLRQEFGPLPQPTLTLVERIRHWLRLPLAKVLVGIAGTLIALVFVANVTVSDVCSLASQSMASPHNRSVAGDQEELSGIYFNDKPHALSRLGAKVAACTGFCLAQYYLAHAELESGKFEDAAAAFQRILAQKDQWPAIVEAEKITWNEWLTHRCGNSFTEADNQALEGFCNSPDDVVQAKAKAFKAGLNNPLRVLRLR